MYGPLKVVVWNSCFPCWALPVLSPHDSRISRFSGTRERQPQSVKMPSVFFTISFKDNFRFVCFFWMAWVVDTLLGQFNNFKSVTGVIRRFLG